MIVYLSIKNSLMTRLPEGHPLRAPNHLGFRSIRQLVQDQLLPVVELKGIFIFQ